MNLDTANSVTIGMILKEHVPCKWYNMEVLSSNLCKFLNYTCGTVYPGSGYLPNHIFLRVLCFMPYLPTTMELPFNSD